MTKQEQKEFREKIQDALLSQLDKVTDLKQKEILLNTVHYLEEYDKNNKILNRYLDEHRFDRYSKEIEIE